MRLKLVDADMFEVVTTKLPDGMDAESYIAGMDFILNKIDDAPTIEPEQKWIPCSEKAHPDLPIRVQVQLDNGWIITAYYQNDEWMSVPDCGAQLDDDEIEAWRELPEPYREKS